MSDGFFGIFSTFVVLLVLLSETLSLYANLARSIIRRRNERSARQMTMNAMAASIANEIGQPLTAILTNAGTGLYCLTKTPPDLDEVRASSRTSLTTVNVRAG